MLNDVREVCKSAKVNSYSRDCVLSLVNCSSWVNGLDILLFIAEFVVRENTTEDKREF
jgi:hypothetical protein